MSKFDGEIYLCKETGKKCWFIEPNKELCEEMFGENPDPTPTKKCGLCKFLKYRNNQRYCEKVEEFLEETQEGCDAFDSLLIKEMMVEMAEMLCNQ